MFLLKILRDVISALRKGESPTQVAGGLTLGLAIGLTPDWPLHIIVLLLFTLIVNVNLSVAIAGTVIAAVIAYVADPLLHSLGQWMLTDMSGLKAIWQTMYNNPLLALTRFNNSVVMGAFILTILMVIPAFFVFKLMLAKMQARWVSKIKGWGIFKRLMDNKIINYLFRQSGGAL